MGRVCSLHLCHAGLSALSFSSLLRPTGSYVPHRPPVCDGAGSTSSHAWLKWAADLDLAKKVYSHISLSRPEHPLSEEEQSQALDVLCQSLGLDPAKMGCISPGQPFRLE